VRRIRALLRLIRREYFLWRYDVLSYEDYERLHSGRVNYKTSVINDYYPGYNHIAFLTYQNTGWQNLFEMRSWCIANCKERYLISWHRASWTECSGWVAGPFGDHDVFTVAFMNEIEYGLFLLRWL
jgi:hypothetical protein